MTEDNPVSTEETEESSVLGPSRRTVVKGAAWSVPVIAAAFAAPAQAASGCTTQIGADKSATATETNLGFAAPAVSALVPTGATRMHFVVVGGSGGGGGAVAALYLKGAYIEGDIAVTAGTTYYLLAGAGGGIGRPYGGTGQGGKSLYGNGGDGGSGPSGISGFGGGGASAIVPGNPTALSSAIVVAGGGGGLNFHQSVNNPPSPLYSSTMVHDQALSNGFQAYGGRGSGGVPSAAGTAAAGDTGGVGWLGTRASAFVDPATPNIVLLAGGGRGGQAAASTPGAGGVAGYMPGTPNFANYWIVNGFAGNGHHGGAGATNGTPASSGFASGGGGGYGGGGGGATSYSQWNTPPAPYAGTYGINGVGGGGSSYVSPSVQNLSARLDTRTSTSYLGLMGYVIVQFFAC